MLQVICEVLELTDTTQVPSMVTFNVLSEDESKEIPPVTVSLRESIQFQSNEVVSIA
jgi:hypothetical protein